MLLAVRENPGALYVSTIIPQALNIASLASKQSNVRCLLIGELMPMGVTCFDLNLLFHQIRIFLCDPA